MRPILVAAFVALILLAIVQRVRAATTRRQARGWVATLNLLAAAFSVTLFLVGAYLSSRWIPDAFAYACLGLAAGTLLGLVGTRLTRWEFLDGRLYYSPNGWLVATVMLVVTARVLYGCWRAWDAWRASVDATTWVAASWLEASMLAGAIVLGYYMTYWMGVRDRLHGESASWDR